MSTAYIDHIVGISQCTAFYVYFVQELLYQVLSSPLFSPLNDGCQNCFAKMSPFFPRMCFLFRLTALNFV